MNYNPLSHHNLSFFLGFRVAFPWSFAVCNKKGNKKNELGQSDHIGGKKTTRKKRDESDPSTANHFLFFVSLLLLFLFLLMFLQLGIFHFLFFKRALPNFQPFVKSQRGRQKRKLIKTSSLFSVNEYRSITSPNLTFTK